MFKILLQTERANYYGTESIDADGKVHYHPLALKGFGKLIMTEDGLQFNQFISKKEYNIPLHAMTKIEIKSGHNLKVKYPRKVLRIFYKEEGVTKVFGISIGGKFSFVKGWQDDAPMWKNEMEQLLSNNKL